ncbi:hypothetical protein SI65_00075 [Aspergillus cristatus]|uniref:Oxidoreductase acuF-like C2H2 type zinc-finger domain-containing protein n=1 Tax=Aspergillus cristatus TaxID=573508 RepID=A0A1E3BNL2_ASPCR|nr:hypothetical protein SI65_00075 [Aspergillus cristatus]
MSSLIRDTESLASVAHHISAAFTFVQESTADSTSYTGRAGIVNEQQRFELWATNLGLYHGGHSSLDYRFRDASIIFEYTRGLLRELESILTQLLRTLNDNGEQRPGKSTNKDGREELNSEDEFSSDEDSSYGDLPLTTLLLENVQQTVDRLYRLAFKIRNPAMRLGLSKASGHRELDPETGVNLVDRYAEIDQRHVLELLASHQRNPADNLQNHYLVHRLAKANTRRRQQFLYWRRRDFKFERYPKPQREGRQIEVVDEAAPTEQERVERFQLNVPQSAPSGPSSVTALDESRVKLDDDVSMVSSSTVFTMDREENSDWVCIPEPPEKYWDQKEFKCPYCYTLCPRKLLAKKAWETHVIRDLRPYVCTYADCSMADQLYDSLTDWMSHEAATHRAVVESSRGKADTSPHSDSRECPFCLVENASPFHIASHLCRIASFTLPRSIGHGTESGPEGSASDQAQVISQESRDGANEGDIDSSDKSVSWSEAESLSPGAERTGSSLTAETLNRQTALAVKKSPQIERYLQQLDGHSVESDGTASGARDRQQASDQVSMSAGMVLNEDAENPLSQEAEASQTSDDSIMINLASAYEDQGWWNKAEVLEVQMLERCKKVLGSEHPDTLTSMNNLASAYWNQGRWKEAEELFVQVMETQKQVLGPDHPSTLTSMNNLASTYRNQGRWKEAEELFVQVMETQKQVLGPDHPDTLTSMSNLASTYCNQ